MVARIGVGATGPPKTAEYVEWGPITVHRFRNSAAVLSTRDLYTNSRFPRTIRTIRSKQPPEFGDCSPAKDEREIK